MHKCRVQLYIMGVGHIVDGMKRADKASCTFCAWCSTPAVLPLPYKVPM